MIIDCIADLHGHYPKLEGGDLLIVAGDLTSNDSEESWAKFDSWIYDQKYECKVIIAGNHDNFLCSTSEHIMWKYWDKVPNTHYLCDSGTEFEGLKIWGSPWTLTFPGINPKCTAFTCDDGGIADRMEKAPRDIDILITHGPAYSVLDETCSGVHAGSPYLYGWLKYVGRPKAHIFGHIHEAYGQKEHFSGCQSINCSHVNERYQPVNEPVRIIL